MAKRSGEVVKLDRGFPLVQLEDATSEAAQGEQGEASAPERIRCEHSADMVKHSDVRAVIGDHVEVDVPDGHDMGIITAISPRKTALVRKDPNERASAQILAANFDQVIIVQPMNNLNLKRLERELVLAFETGARVAVLLTKRDLVTDAEAHEAIDSVGALVGGNVRVLSTSKQDPSGTEAVRALLSPDTTTVLMGQSGVGKSTLINNLVGSEIRQTQSVRETDQKGRHTTVSREIISVPHAGRIVDMPGVRGLGLWDAEAGIAAAFADVDELSRSCKFRDCRHVNEPGCAIQEAIHSGALSQERVDSYLSLQSELESIKEKRKQASWKRR